MWLGVWAKARSKFRRVFAHDRSCECELYLFYESFKIHPDKHLLRCICGLWHDIYSHSSDHQRLRSKRGFAKFHQAIFYSDANFRCAWAKKSEAMIHFLALLLAGCCEVSGVFFINKFEKSSGVKKWANFILLVGNFSLSLTLLSYAMQVIAMSVAYAIWTGIGAVGAVLVGVVFNNEKVNLEKALFLSLIIISVVMLKIV